MSIHLKLALPYLDDSFTKDDFSKEAGFVGVYTSDKNRPYLTNHIFLLYDFYSNTDKSVIRDEKFLKSACLYEDKVILVKQKPYLLYTFCICDNHINEFFKNNSFCDEKTLIKIAKFWGFSDEEVNSYIYNRWFLYNFKDEELPEEDWKPDLNDAFKVEHY